MRKGTLATVAKTSGTIGQCGTKTSFKLCLNKERSDTKDGDVSVTDRGVQPTHRPQRHISSFCALQQTRSRTHSFSCVTQAVETYHCAIIKKNVIFSHGDLHPSLAWRHSCTSQTPPSSSRQTNRPTSQIAMTRERTLA